MKKRLIIITQWFDPEPTSKGLYFARELKKKDYEVEVITGFPNYPGGKIYSEYKVRFIQRELLDNVLVTRIPLFPSHDKSSIGRILNYLSFSLSVFIYGLFIIKNNDIVYVYHPPLTVGIAACFIKKFRKIPIVYDVQDIWPDTLRATGVIKNNYILNFVSFLCDYVYKNVNYIVVSSPGFKTLLIERGVTESKISIIYNWTKDDRIFYSNLIYKDIVPKKFRFKIMFAGNIGKAQAIEAIIDAASILNKRLPHVCFIILGSGVELKNQKKYALSRKTDNVFFLPPVSMKYVNEYLEIADILIVHLKADPLFEITIPSKTQAYMAAGKPILMAVEGDAARLINSAKCGLTAKSEDPDDIAEKVEQFVSLDRNQLIRLGQNGKIYYRNNLSLDVGIRKFTEIFRLVSK